MSAPDATGDRGEKGDQGQHGQDGRAGPEGPVGGIGPIGGTGPRGGTSVSFALLLVFLIVILTSGAMVLILKAVDNSDRIARLEHRVCVLEDRDC